MVELALAVVLCKAQHKGRYMERSIIFMSMSACEALKPTPPHTLFLGTGNFSSSEIVVLDNNQAHVHVTKPKQL